MRVSAAAAVFGRAAVAVFAALTANIASAQEDLFGRAILSYQKLDSDLLSSSGFRQTYDLRLERAVSDALRVRLSFRGEGNDGTSGLDGTSDAKTQFRQYQPGAELLYTLSAFQLQANYDDIRTASSSGDLSNERTLQRSYGRFTWKPDRLPTLMVYGEKRRLKDGAAATDKTEDSVFQALDYTWKGLSLGQNARVQTLDDGGTDFARKSTDVQGLARYESTLFGGRAAVSASVLAGLTRLDERARSGTAVSVPLRLTIPRALFSHDDTPLDGRDKPLVDLPALVDGDFLRPAGIPLGPDGASYQNIAVDMARFVQLDTLRVYVRDAEGHAVRDGGLVRFDAYRSDDGLSWIPLPGGARTSFDAAQSLYAVDFALVNARFLKVVSFGTNLLDTQVTEIEVLQHQKFAAGEVKRTDIRLGSGTATASGKLTGWLTLSYYGLFNTTTQTSTTRPELSTNDSDQIASVQVDALDDMNLIGRYEKRVVSQTDGYGQSLDAISAIAHYAPLKTLDATVEYRRSKQDLAGRTSTSDGLSGHLTLRLLKSLDVSVDAGLQREGAASDGHPATHQSLTAVTYAQVTDDLKLTANASFQKTSYEGGTPDDAGNGLLLPASKDARYWGQIYYRPGPQIALTGRFGYASSAAFSGLTQSYRVEWYPFATGTVSIGAVYDEDLDSVSNRRFTRIQVLPRWRLNKSATLDLNYSILSTYEAASEGGAAFSLSSRNFWATFTLAF